MIMSTDSGVLSQRVGDTGSKIGVATVGRGYPGNRDFPEMEKNSDKRILNKDA